MPSKVVEELLSKSGAIGQEAAKTIADAAMLEVASTNVPHMVNELNRAQNLPNPSSIETNSSFSSQAPDDFYEGITFEHFEQVCPHTHARTFTCTHTNIYLLMLLSLLLQILKGLEMESRMHIRFLDVDTTTMRCGKSSS